jgi:RNA polymerase sigma-70 factor (ECF subfamily)
MPLFQTPKERFFEELVESTRSALFDFARAHVKDVSQAEDAVQDACYTAWVKIDALMDSPNPEGWLMNALKYQIHKQYDKLASEKRIAAKLFAKSPDSGAVYMDESGDVPFTAALSPDELRIVRLREQGYRHEEIAKLLNVEPGAVRTRLSRIKGKVAKFLEGNA